MTFKDRLLRQPSINEPWGSLALPNFSFEGDERPLVSTERLFRQWEDEESQYDPGSEYAECDVRKEQDIIVRFPTYIRMFDEELTSCRSHGTVHTTPGIHSTGPTGANG